MENPFGSNLTITEYSEKYMKELDRFIQEAKENGVWVFPIHPIDAETKSWPIMMFGLDNNAGLRGYMPIWSSPAEGLSLSMHIDGPSLQSIPLDAFIDVMMEDRKPGIVAALNPVIRNGKPDANGKPSIGVVPPILLPFEILFAVYKGIDHKEFASDLAFWISASHSITYDF